MSPDAATILTELTALECRMLRAEVRADPVQMRALLHPAFVEVGASGRTYTRDEVIAEFEGNPPKYTVRARDFAIDAVADGLVLLRYRSAHDDGRGALSRHVARTSLWQRVAGAWQLRFHQGTLVDPPRCSE